MRSKGDRNSEMEKQLSFAVNEWNGKKKQTKREKFLDRMEQLVPWGRLVELDCAALPEGGAWGRAKDVGS